MKTPRGSAKVNSFISGSTKTARGRLQGSSASTITPPRSKSGPRVGRTSCPTKSPAQKSGAFFIVPEFHLWQTAQAMEITYELTRKDFTESFAAHRNRRAWAKWTRRIVASLMLLFSALLLFGSVRTGNTRTLLPFFALVAMWLVILAGLPWWWSARRQFLKQPGAHGTRTVSLDDLGAHWRWNGGSSHVEWKNYVRLLESKNQFLLYTSPACFNIIPKRALVTEQMSEIRNLLKQRVPARD
jgi:hypothetical protein